MLSRKKRVKRKVETLKKETKKELEEETEQEPNEDTNKPVVSITDPPEEKKEPGPNDKIKCCLCETTILFKNVNRHELSKVHLNNNKQ